MLKTILTNWLIPAIILVTALVAAYFFGAGWAGVIVAALFCLTLVWAIFAVLREQRKQYRENRISGSQLIRNALLEIVGILLAVALASVLGRWIAEVATQQINNQLMKFIAGMITGFLAGLGVGFLVKQMWGRMVKMC